MQDIAQEGKVVARIDGKVVFVSVALPGDVCSIQIIKSKKDFAEARVLEIETPSPHRVQPFCSHFGECGGCKWQDLNYTTQLAYKHQTAVEAIRRIGKTEPLEVRTILACEQQQYYRNKLEYTFSNKRWRTRAEMHQPASDKPDQALGFHVSFLFDKIVDVDTCYMQPDPSNAIRRAVRDFCLSAGYSFFDLRKQEGLMRNLIIRTSSSGQVMVIVSFHEDQPEPISLLMEMLRTTFPSITSLYYVVNTKGNDTIHDLPLVLYAGSAAITEQMEDLRLLVSPKSFFQTNALQALRLYQVVREFAGLQGREHVYDLYTGTGSIALFLARQAARVTGLEYVEAAVEDARQNALFNNIGNTAFFAGDMKELLSPAFMERQGRPDVVITDPPRAGMHENVVKQLLEAAPQKIVYVSCNPATQARDILLLKDQYEATLMQPVDMFPHTHHIENVLLLSKRP